MYTHPAILMVSTWLFAVLLYLIFPFELTTRVISSHGILILVMFIGAFCIGAIIHTLPVNQIEFADSSEVDFERVDRLLIAAITIAIVVVTIK